MNRLLCILLSALLCSVVPAAGQALATTREERGSIAAAAAALSRQSALRLSARAQGGSRPCGQTMLIGLGVGASAGATIGGLAWRSFDQPAAGFAATTGVLGLLGLAVGYKLCR